MELLRIIAVCLGLWEPEPQPIQIMSFPVQTWDERSEEILEYLQDRH